LVAVLTLRCFLPSALGQARVTRVQGLCFDWRSFSLHLFLVFRCSSLIRWCPIGDISVKQTSGDSDTDTQALKVAESWVKEEDIEEEIGDHSKVAKHLKFARGLILEGVEFHRLGPDNTQGHPHKHQPINWSEDTRIVEKGLVESEHCCTSKNGLNYVCPGCQRRRACFLHCSQSNCTHSNEHGIQYQENKG